jgi:hypothetical protein
MERSDYGRQAAGATPIQGPAMIDPMADRANVSFFQLGMAY